MCVPPRFAPCTHRLPKKGNSPGHVSHLPVSQVQVARAEAGFGQLRAFVGGESVGIGGDDAHLGPDEAWLGGRHIEERHDFFSPISWNNRKTRGKYARPETIRTHGGPKHHTYPTGFKTMVGFNFYLAYTSPLSAT